MLNLIDEEVFFKISDAVLDKNYKAVFEVTNIIYENGWDFTDFLDGLIEHFRNILLVLITNSSDAIESADSFKKKYLEYTDKYSESDLLRLLNFLNKSHQEIRFSQNQKIKTEIILSHLIALEKTSTITDVISGLSLSESEVLFGEQKESYTSNIPSIEKKKQLVTKPALQNSVQKSSSPLNENDKLNQPLDNQIEEINFDNIVNKWKGFVDFISLEKGLTLGPALQGFNLISLAGNKLLFSGTDEQDKKLFEMHENYIEKKSEEFFGKRLKFNWSKAKTEIQSSESTPSSKLQTTKDPFEEVIINELGGEKIQ
jgi:DNA polymerase-3 subunit gamma/tau